MTAKRAVGSDALRWLRERYDRGWSEQPLGRRVARGLPRRGHDDAEDALRRALAIKEKRLGSEHPSLSSTLTNLGDVYFERAEHDEALALHARAVRLREGALGEHNPRLAPSLTGLALDQLALGDDAGAASTARRVLTLDTQSVDPLYRGRAEFVLARTQSDIDGKRDGGETTSTHTDAANRHLRNAGPAGAREHERLGLAFPPEGEASVK